MKNLPLRTGEKCGIYQILNTVTKDFYIGSSRNIYYRARRHLSELRGGTHGNPILQNSFNKHGEDKFYTSVLEETTEVKLLKREEWFINTLKPKYNILGLKVQRPVVSESMKKKLSKAIKKAHKEGRLHSNRKAIDVFNLKGKKIGNYRSMKETAKALKISWDSIHRVLVGEHQQNKGYIFRYTKDNILEVTYTKAPHNMGSICKPIICTNLETSELYTFNCLKDVKAVFSTSIIYNIQVGTPYQGIYLLEYAT